MEDRRRIENLIRALSTRRGWRKKTKLICACIVVRGCGQTVVDGFWGGGGRGEADRLVGCLRGDPLCRMRSMEMAASLCKLELGVRVSMIGHLTGALTGCIGLID